MLRAYLPHIADPLLRRVVEDVLGVFGDRDRARWGELRPETRAYLKSLAGKFKDVGTDDEVSRADVLEPLMEKIEAEVWTGLPPCIRRAVAVRDRTTIDEIFSFFHTYGTEKADAVLWSIGYYTLDSYDQKKLTAEAQIRTAPHFPCTPLEKPRTLSKYCPGRCPLRDHTFRANLIVDKVYMVYNKPRRTATVTVHLRDGTAFVLRNIHYNSNNLDDVLRRLAEEFLAWYSETHSGHEYPDFLRVSVDALVDILFSKMERVVVNDGEY
jgi:hypothetical protein